MFRMLKFWLTPEPVSRPRPKPQLGLTTLETREVPAVMNQWAADLVSVGPVVGTQPAAATSAPAFTRLAIGTVAVKTAISGVTPAGLQALKDVAERAAFANVAKGAVAGLTQQTGLTATLARLGSTGVDTSGLVPGGASRLRSDPAGRFGGTSTLGAKAHDLGVGFSPRGGAHATSPAGTIGNSLPGIHSGLLSGGSLLHSFDSRQGSRGGAPIDSAQHGLLAFRNSLISEPLATGAVVDFWGDLFNETNENYGAVATTALVVGSGLVVGYTIELAYQYDQLSDPVDVLSFGGASYDLRKLGSAPDGQRKWVPDPKTADGNNKSPSQNQGATPVKSSDNGPAPNSEDHKENVPPKSLRDGGTKTRPDPDKPTRREPTAEEVAEQERFRRSLTINPGHGDDGVRRSANRPQTGRQLTKLDLYGRPDPDAVVRRPMSEQELKAAIAFQKGTYTTPQGGGDPAHVGYSGGVDPAFLGLMEAEQQQGVREARDEAAKRISG